MKIKQLCAYIFMFTLVLLLFGCSEESGSNTESTNTSSSEESANDESTNNSNNNADSTESNGGELRYASAASPPTLDVHISPTAATRDVARHIFEQLITVDENFEPIPMLAESWEISDDGTTYTFYLRKGVQFHNGKELTSEDVVASLERWSTKNSTATTILEDATFSAEDKYTVVLQLQQPSVFVLDALTGTVQFSAIMPKEVIESATDKGVEEYIGTGPFKFAEWKQDQYIHLTKFEDYQALDTPANGLGGKKEALVDDLYFDIMSDSSTRLAGLQTGQYDIGYGYEIDMLDMLENDPNINVLNPISSFLSVIFNKNEESIFSNIKMRQALATGLDLEEISVGSYGDSFEMDSSYMEKSLATWYSSAGSEYYNENDQEKAKRLLDEAGYNGETIKLMTTRDYAYNYNAAVVIQQQLEEIGVNVELEVFDWPTVTTRRDDPNLWDLMITRLDAAIPVQHLFYNSEWYAGPLDDKTEELLNEIKAATSIEEAQKIWEELQGYSWEFLPILKIAHTTTIVGIRDHVEGYEDVDGPVLWNTRVVK